MAAMAPRKPPPSHYPPLRAHRGTPRSQGSAKVITMLAAAARDAGRGLVATGRGGTGNGACSGLKLGWPPLPPPSASATGRGAPSASPAQARSAAGSRITGPRPCALCTHPPTQAPPHLSLTAWSAQFACLLARPQPAMNSITTVTPRWNGKKDNDLNAPNEIADSKKLCTGLLVPVLG